MAHKGSGSQQKLQQARNKIASLRNELDSIRNKAKNEGWNKHARNYKSVKKQLSKWKKFKSKFKSSPSPQASSSKPLPKTGTVRRTRVQVAGQTITGFVDSRGRFSADTIKGATQFQQIKKTFRTDKVSEINRIKNIPDVKRQLTNIKGDLRQLSIKQQKEERASRKKQRDSIKAQKGLEFLTSTGQFKGNNNKLSQQKAEDSKKRREQISNLFTRIKNRIKNRAGSTTSGSPGSIVSGVKDINLPKQIKNFNNKTLKDLEFIFNITNANPSGSPGSIVSGVKDIKIPKQIKQAKDHLKQIEIIFDISKAQKPKTPGSIITGIQDIKIPKQIKQAKDRLKNIEIVFDISKAQKPKTPGSIISGVKKTKTFKPLVGPRQPIQKGEFTLNTIKQFSPVLNNISQSAYKKLRNGELNKITFKEAANVAFDIVSLIPIIGWGIRGGVTAIRVGNAVSLSKKLNIARSTNKANNLTILSPQAIRSLLDTSASIIRNTGFSSRSYNAAQDYLKVDNKLISSILPNLANYVDDKTGKKAFKTSNDIYKDYVATLQSKVNLLDKKLNQNDLYVLLGVDAISKKRLIEGQKEYLNFLLDNGVKRKKAISVMQQLENKRRARVFGQIVGAISIEISSERASQTLLKLGVGKKKAVAVGGAREGLAFLSSEAFIQDNQITPGDLGYAVFGGALGSIYFSKSKFKKISQKSINNKINLVAAKINNNLKPSKQNKYVVKSIKAGLKKQGKPTSKIDIDKIKKTLTKGDKNKISKNYIKNSLKQGKLKKIIPTKKATLLLRDPIANIIDPFEIVGDNLFDLSELIKRKLSIRASKKISKFNKSKIKSTSKVKSLNKTTNKTKTSVKSKNKTKTKVPSKTKIKSKSKTKSKTKTKIKIKSKSKTKTKTKIKIKSKSKSKTKTKTKSKSKSKTKTKTKTKTKSIPFPFLNFPSIKLKKGERLRYNARYKAKGKIVRLKLGLPQNLALKRASSLIDRTTSRSMEIYVAGITKLKDIKKPKLLSKFRITKSKKTSSLKLVERSKHLIDTKGEKRGLTIAKLLKSKKRMKKSIKKVKKSSNKRSKTRKMSKV